ncbi:hypothetical protein Pla123a_18270 [Posidoniimonas polymericola]|uniref:Uncharacterized protein n=1 Tax=Posidoniimonas polymericola TaxID=2528002 RepID=A0A5C5YTN7_9BACT|nr:hypothetical protein Pla123a_18270 [Posidoniimonas polymericola]
MRLVRTPACAAHQAEKSVRPTSHRKTSNVQRNADDVRAALITPPALGIPDVSLGRYPKIGKPQAASLHARRGCGSDTRCRRSETGRCNNQADPRNSCHPSTSRSCSDKATGNQPIVSRRAIGQGRPSGSERESQTNASADPSDAPCRARSCVPIGGCPTGGGLSEDVDLVVPSLRQTPNAQGDSHNNAARHSRARRGGPPKGLEIVETPRCVNVGAYSASKLSARRLYDHRPATDIISE